MHLSPHSPAAPASPSLPHPQLPPASRQNSRLNGRRRISSPSRLTCCLLVYLAWQFIAALPQSPTGRSAPSGPNNSGFYRSEFGRSEFGRTRIKQTGFHPIHPFAPRLASAHPGHAHPGHAHSSQSHSPPSRQNEIDEFLRDAGDQAPATVTHWWQLRRAQLLLASLGLIATLTAVRWQFVRWHLVRRQQQTLSPPSESSPDESDSPAAKSMDTQPTRGQRLISRWQPQLMLFLLVATAIVLQNAWRTLTVELPTQPDLRAALGTVAALGGLLIGGVTRRLLGHWLPRLLQEPFLPGQSLLTALALTASAGLIIALALSPIVANRPSLFVGIAGLALVAGSGLAGPSHVAQRGLLCIAGRGIAGRGIAGAVTIFTLLFAGVLLADGYSLDHTGRMVWGTTIALLTILLLP